MRVKVVGTSKTQTYVSHVFAMLGNGWHLQFIVFDPHTQALKIVNRYNLKNLGNSNVYVLDSQTPQEWISVIKHNKNQYCGYDWLQNIKQDIKNPANIKKAEEIAAQDVEPEWNYVSTQKDADNLMESYGGFHDAYITNIFYESDGRFGAPHAITLCFNTCWSTKLAMIFEGDISLHFCVEQNCINNIMEGTLIVDNNYILWADDCIETIADTNTDFTWVKSTSLKWRLIFDERQENENSKN